MSFRIVRTIQKRGDGVFSECFFLFLVDLRFFMSKKLPNIRVLLRICHQGPRNSQRRVSSACHHSPGHIAHRCWRDCYRSKI